jgi:hypothetical protein
MSFSDPETVAHVSVWVYRCTTVLDEEGELTARAASHPDPLRRERRCGRLDLRRIYTDEELERRAVDEEAPCPDCGGYAHAFVAFTLVPAGDTEARRRGRRV